RGMFEAVPLPLDWPVYVSQVEASAYARWKGRRLMTEAEFHRAAEGAAAGHHDFAGFDPVPVGSFPSTASVHRVHHLIGNGGEGEGLGAVGGLGGNALVPRVLGGFLRRPPLRDEGRVAGDGVGAAASELPELVPRELSVCLREVQNGSQLISRATSGAISR